MALWFDPVRNAINRIATRDGVTLDDVAASFRELEGNAPDPLKLSATLAALRFTGEVYRNGDRYFTREVGGPGEPFDWRKEPSWRRPLDVPPPNRYQLLDDRRRELACLQRDLAGLSGQYQPASHFHVHLPTFVDPPTVEQDGHLEHRRE